MPGFDMALVERIDAAIRTVNIRFGPNALAIMRADGTVPLSLGESWAMALAVAGELSPDAADQRLAASERDGAHARLLHACAQDANLTGDGGGEPL
jgi:hypothetical protein